MNPVLIPYKDFHEEYRLSAFDSFIHQTISEVMNIHFMLVDVQNQTAKQASVTNSVPSVSQTAAKKEPEKPAASGGYFGKSKKSGPPVVEIKEEA